MYKATSYFQRAFCNFPFVFKLFFQVAPKNFLVRDIIRNEPQKVEEYIRRMSLEQLDAPIAELGALNAFPFLKEFQAILFLKNVGWNAVNRSSRRRPL